MSSEITVVFADKCVERRRAILQKLPAWIATLECDSIPTLLRVVMNTEAAIIVVGSLGDEPASSIKAAHLVRGIQTNARVVIIADVSSESMAIEALRAGVYEYLKEPVSPTEVAEVISRAIGFSEEPNDGFDELVGSSAPIQEVKNLIRKIAPLNSTVLITGESGVGKEVVARLIHKYSSRVKAPFVSVNCAAIPDSLIESELFGHERGAFTGAVGRQGGQMQRADRGTLFLDEIGDMSQLAQAKVLRALEQREVKPLGGSRTIPIDIRLITATNQDLNRLVAESRFRSDLYYRLDINRIHLPSLRERAEDIPVLAVHFVRMLNRAYGRRLMGLTPAALQTLARHQWPGNVRQLRNVIEGAAAICASDRISDMDLRALRSFSSSAPPALVRTTAVAADSTKRFKPEKDILLNALQTTHWNMTRTAELLHWSRSTLYRNMARYKIERPEEQTAPNSQACAEDEQDLHHGPSSDRRYQTQVA